jgi:hypothetical protein
MCPHINSVNRGMPVVKFNKNKYYFIIKKTFCINSPQLLNSGHTNWAVISGT